MEKLQAMLAGKKTYLVVVALMLLNVLTEQEAVDVTTLQETLTLGLVATFRAALAKVSA